MSVPHTTPTRAQPPPSSEAQPQITSRPQANSSTPIRKSLQGSLQWASHSKADAEILKKDMARELRGQWIGPMPIETFISTFLPLSDETLATKPSFEPKHFSKMKEEQAEISMYEPFIKLIHVAKATPGFKLVNTSQYADPKCINGMKSKPDVACYPNEVNTTKTRTRYEDMEVIFEFKPKREPADPFEDDPKKSATADEEGDEEEVVSLFEDKGKERTRCRGQIACYARIWCARQHRTHCFIVWIGDPNARIIRFDRSGGIVSAKFNYRTDGHLLLDFLWRLSTSSRRARGMDTTVTRASKEETRLVRDKLVQWKPTSGRSVFKLQIPDPDSDEDDSPKTHSVFVWGPLADPESVTGRATRGYPAWDADWNDGEGRIVFVKDSWRSCQPGMEKESAILKTLNKAGVRNVPQLLWGDDLPGQFTVTQDYAEESWNKGASKDQFVRRAHTRFAEDFVGVHLNTYNTPKEFFQAVYDAFLAHKDAYEKCHILHRDVSAGNILIKEGGGGILNDWDLARYVEVEHHARQPFRSGTWQFMSTALLEEPSKTHSVQDDMESFFWVVLYHVLRYMKHSMPTKGLEKSMKNIFEQAEEHTPGQPDRGGQGKRKLITTAMPLTMDFKIHENEPLTTFVHVTLNHLGNWHRYLADVVSETWRIALASKICSHEAALIAHANLPLTIRRNETNLRDHSEMVTAFEAALAHTSWPVVRALNNLPRDAKRGKQDSEEESTGSDNDSNDEEDATSDESPRNKRMKTDDKAYSGRVSRHGSSVEQTPLATTMETRHQKEALKKIYPSGHLE